MKINNNTIRILSRISSADLLQNIQIGRKISASITDKIDNNHAVLNIAGQKVKAEFLQGVPGSDSINLVLEKKGNGLFVFKIIDNFNNDEFIEKLFEFSVFNRDNIDKKSLFELSRYLKDGVPNMFAYNSLFLKIHGNKQFVENDIVNLLNNLIKFGIAKENLLFFSAFFSALKGFNIDYLSSILLILGMDNDIISEHKKIFKDEKLLKEKLNNLLEEVKGLLAQKKEGHEQLKKIIDLLLYIDTINKNSIFASEMPYYVDDEFKSVKYIYHNRTFVFTLELTNLGIVEILFKDFPNSVRIDIFCARENSLSALQNRIDQLYHKLKDVIDKDFNINLYNTQSIIEKIIEINSYRLLNRTLDVKV